MAFSWERSFLGHETSGFWSHQNDRPILSPLMTGKVHWGPLYPRDLNTRDFYLKLNLLETKHILHTGRNYNTIITTFYLSSLANRIESDFFFFYINHENKNLTSIEMLMFFKFSFVFFFFLVYGVSVNLGKTWIFQQIVLEDCAVFLVPCIVCQQIIGCCNLPLQFKNRYHLTPNQLQSECCKWQTLCAFCINMSLVCFETKNNIQNML